MNAADWHRFAALLRLIRAGQGVGPSFTEIGAAWGQASKSGVSRHMDTLRAAGLIDWLPAKARSIRVTQHLMPVRDRAGNTVFAADT